jgi:hypothetical protein
MDEAKRPDIEVTPEMLAAAERAYDEWCGAGGPDECDASDMLVSAFRAMVAAKPLRYVTVAADQEGVEYRLVRSGPSKVELLLEMAKQPWPVDLKD